MAKTSLVCVKGQPPRCPRHFLLPTLAQALALARRVRSAGPRYAAFVQVNAAPGVCPGCGEELRWEPHTKGDVR